MLWYVRIYHNSYYSGYWVQNILQYEFKITQTVSSVGFTQVALQSADRYLIQLLYMRSHELWMWVWGAEVCGV